MNDKQQLAALGAEIAEQPAPLCMARQIEQLQSQLADATQQCGAMVGLLREVVDHQRLCCGTLAPLDEWAALVERIEGALAGNVPEPRITQPARIGGVRFGVGVKVSAVIDAAYRAAEYEQPDGKANLDALMAVIHGRTLEGWQLVPVEPNYAMVSADGCKEHHEGQSCIHHDNRRRIWAAMLAAAPKQQGGEA